MTTEVLHEIGCRIRELRKEANESQESFAHRCGIDNSYMSDIECGKRNVSIFFLDVIITALGCGYSNFFNTEYFKNNPKP